MNRGKVANIIEENIEEEISTYLEEREKELEDLQLIEGFKKFAAGDKYDVRVA